MHEIIALELDAENEPMFGGEIEVDEEFKEELDGYQCHVALAIGYQHPEDDFNAMLSKFRRIMNSVFVQI